MRHAGGWGHGLRTRGIVPCRGCGRPVWLCLCILACRCGSGSRHGPGRRHAPGAMPGCCRLPTPLTYLHYAAIRWSPDLRSFHRPLTCIFIRARKMFTCDFGVWPVGSGPNRSPCLTVPASAPRQATAGHHTPRTTSPWPARRGGQHGVADAGPDHAAHAHASSTGGSPGSRHVGARTAVRTGGPRHPRKGGSHSRSALATVAAPRPASSSRSISLHAL